MFIKVCRAAQEKTSPSMQMLIDEQAEKLELQGISRQLMGEDAFYKWVDDQVSSANENQIKTMLNEERALASQWLEDDEDDTWKEQLRSSLEGSSNRGPAVYTHSWKHALVREVQTLLPRSYSDEYYNTTPTNDVTIHPYELCIMAEYAADVHSLAGFYKHAYCAINEYIPGLTK